MASKEAATSLSIAQGHLDADDYKEAIRLGEQAQDVFRAASDWKGFADTTRLIINARCGLEERKTANALAKETLELLQRNAGTDTAQATMKLAVAEVNYDKRGSQNRQLARKSAEEALKTFQRDGDKKMQADALILLCNIALKDKAGAKDVLGKQARTYCVQALKLQRSLGDRKQEALVMHNLATAFVAQRDVRAALKASKEALKIFRELGEKKLEAYELQCSALWQAESEQFEAALTDAQAALAVAKDVEGDGGRGLEASILGTLVKIQGELNADHAVKSAKDGLRRFRELKDKGGEAQALKAFASATKEHDPQNALTTARRSQEAFKAAGDTCGERQVQRMMSELQIRVCRGDRALDAAMLSLEMSERQVGKDGREMATSTLTVARAYLARGELDKVIEYANEAQSICKSAKWKKGEAEALKLICQARVALEDFDEGLSAIEAAKDLLKGDGDRLGEVSLYAMMAEVQILQENFKAAVETSTIMRDVGRQLKDTGCEVNALLLGARAGVKLAQQEGARPGDASYEAAYRAAKESLTLSRLLRDRQLVASAQYMMGELLMLSADLESALGAAIESVSLSRFAGYLHGEASATLLCSKLHAFLTEMEEAWETATRAMHLYRQCGDSKGAEEAANVLEQLYPYFQKKAAPAAASAAAAAPEGPSASAMEAVGHAAPQMKALGERAAVTGAITKDLIKNKLVEVLQDNLGLDPDDFEEDTPFMSAGVTSTGAILIQTAVSQDFAQCKIPSTLLFDYPSIGAVAGFILDQIG